jgi:hypothetical protein
MSTILTQSCLAHYLVIIFCLLVVSSCAAHRDITPRISDDPRTSIRLDTPVLISILDSRPADQRTRAVVDSLRADLSRIYGDSLEWTDYFSQTPPGRVAVKIRLLALGADFGSRILVASGYSSTSTHANLTASGPWGPVYGTASGESSTFSSAFSGKGWWVGGAWLESAIHDHRTVPPTTFSVPVAAEHKESNMWGYASGDKAAKAAWQRVSQGLVRVMDAILIVVRDSQQDAAM